MDTTSAAPAADVPEQLRPGSEQESDGPRDRPLVLVLEDNPHHCEIYGRMLCYNGYDVMHAPDGESGLRLARRHTPDLVLLDLMLPGIDGLDVCRCLKAEGGAGAPWVVVLSSRERSQWEQTCLEAGADAYLEKPLSAVEVLHTVESLIGRAPLPGTGRPPLFRSEDASLGD